MDTWSPLFSSIVRSSVWGLAPHVKVVWVTMLAIKDKSGFVESSLVGLARMAVVSPELCREALSIFESPDPESNNKENEGRKIVAVEGGWMILGHERFQQRMKEVSTRIGNAKRQKKHREKSKIPASQDKPSSAAYRAKEAVAIKAWEDGDVAKHDAIAASGL